MSSRDFSKPFTPSELEDLNKFFRKLPTYNPEEGYALSSDVYQMGLYVGYTNYSALSGFKDHLDKHTDGKYTFDLFVEITKTFHDTAQLAKLGASQLDKNGDGFISKEEFEEIFTLVVLHDERAKALSFEEFVREADTNEDGRVSVEECTVWLTKHLNTAKI